MEEILKKRIKNLPDTLRFVLLSIPFTLITIGNATIWLIVRTAVVVRLIFFYLVHLLVFFLQKLFLKANFFYAILSRTLSSFAGILKRPITIRLPRLAKIRRFFPIPRIPRHWLYFILGAFASFLFIFLPYQAYQFVLSLPNPVLLTNSSMAVSTKIFDRHGTLLFELYADKKRTPVRLSEIPLVMRQATIAIEDRDFYHHIGISPRGIIRAAKETTINKRLQGGSTITQQLVKNALLTPEPTINRKIKEIILAFWAERIYSKDQILEMYFNQVPYGGTYWGVEAAAEGYFNKSVSKLNLAEAAFLAGLPAAPTRYSPFGAHPELAKQRQTEVLYRMVEEGFILPREAEEAQRENLVFAPQAVPIKAPHFVMYVKELLSNRYGLRLVEQGGLRITTTLDLDLQQMAEEIVTSELEKLASMGVGNSGVLVTNPKNGEILVMVGSKNYWDKEAEGNVNTTLALHQPGSAIKAVTYAAALQHGFTAASILDDSPITYTFAGQPPYSPVNYDETFHGKIPLRYALGNSYNVPAVKVLAKIGVETMITQGKKMGIKSWQDSSRFGLSLTLGGGDVTMLDMATVYGTLANGGRRHDLTPIIRITTYKGDVLEEMKPKTAFQAVPEEVAFILSDIFSDNKARTWAFGPNSKLVIPGRTVAVKTGTSNDKRDNWAVGYTPSWVTTVWAGNNDNTPMLTSGATGAAPIWQKIMIELLADGADEKFRKPENVVALPCFFGRKEYFIKGTEPKNGCPVLTPPTTPSPTPP